MTQMDELLLQALQPRPSDIVHQQWLGELGITSFEGLKVLDLGCGSGYLCHLAKLRGAVECVGIDLHQPVDNSAHIESWQFIEADLDRPDWHQQLLPAQRFDYIFAFDIIEHLRSPVLFLEQCESLLDPNGQLVLTTPNTNSLERWLRPDSWSGAFDPQHRILFSRYSLGFLLKKTGLNVHQLRAPLRSLRWLPNSIQPPIGGQLLVKATRMQSASGHDAFASEK